MMQDKAKTPEVESYAERKKREFDSTKAGMENILKETRSRVVDINHAACERVQMAEKWTDDQGHPQSRVGSFGSIDPDLLRVPDLVVKSNHRTCQAIVRACRRVFSTVDNLTGMLRTNHRAMPLDLRKYMDRLIAEIPCLDTVVMEQIHPKPAKEPKPEVADDRDKGPAER